MTRSFVAIALMLCACCAVASKPVERIVALSPSSTEMLFEMGLGTRVMGTVEWADFPEAAKAIPRIGSYAGINIEALVALRPDLVVAWKSGNKEADLQKLEALGLNLIYVDPKTMDSVAGSMEELGAAAGVPEAGKAAAQRFRERTRRRPPARCSSREAPSAATCARWTLNSTQEQLRTVFYYRSRVRVVQPPLAARIGVYEHPPSLVQNTQASRAASARLIRLRLSCWPCKYLPFGPEAWLGSPVGAVRGRGGGIGDRPKQ